MDGQLDSLVQLLQTAATSTTEELDSGILAAASTHAEDPWRRLGAKPTAALVSVALLRNAWTVACKGKNGSESSPQRRFNILDYDFSNG